MAFLIVISTVLTAVLSYAFVANRNVLSYQRDRALHFAADGALEVGVEVVQEDTTLGITLTPCGFEFPLDAFNDEGIFAAGAFLVVECSPTPNNPRPPPGPGPNGEQAYRDVTFTVRCHLPTNQPRRAPLRCGATSNPDVLNLGRARVRFDIDPGHTPNTEWAIVPKVISWEITR